MRPPGHRDYEPFELGENMEEDLGLFEAATHARRFVAAPLAVRHVLAVTSGGAAAGVEDVAHALAARLAATVVPEPHADSVAAILTAAARFGPVVVVAATTLPEPVVAGLVAASAGLPVPVVLVPAAPAADPAALDTLVLPLFADAPPTRRACDWACGLAAAAPHGVIHALELASPETRRAARRLARGPSPAAGGIGDATVGRAVSGGLGGIIAGLQRHATRHGSSVDVTFRGGRPVPETLAVVRRLARPATIILGRDDASPGQPLSARFALELAGTGAAVILVA